MDTTKWFIILNPVSGNGKGIKLWNKKIAQIFIQQKIEYELRITDYPKHATFLVQTAIDQGFRQVLAIGGDGTFNEVVNGIMTQKTVPSSEIIFSAIPAGTGNDWVRTMGLTADPDDVRAVLKHGKVYTQDLGLAIYHIDNQKQTKYFLNVAGLGFDAYVNLRLHTNKLKFGQLSYLFEVIRSLFFYRNIATTVKWKNEEVQSPAYTVSVGICAYYGGGVKIAPHAIPNDGLFDVTIAKDLTKWELIKELPHLYSGKFVKHPKVLTFRTESLTLDTKTEGHLQVDGELAGHTPITMKVIPKALKVLIPKNHLT